MSLSRLMIERAVGEQLNTSGVVDVYALAWNLADSCPDLSLESVCRSVTNTVAAHHGAAVWEQEQPLPTMDVEPR